MDNDWASEDPEVLNVEGNIIKKPNEPDINVKSDQRSCRVSNFIIPNIIR
jgi:hypothetical protein